MVYLKYYVASVVQVAEKGVLILDRSIMGATVGSSTHTVSD